MPPREMAKVNEWDTKKTGKQALLDDLDDLVRADAARARRATRGRAGIVAAAALGGLAAYVVLPLAL